MKKKIVCLTLALLMTASQAVSVSASREDDLREEQAITSQQLDATYSRTDELSGSSIIFRGNVVARRAKNHYFLHIRT